MNVFYYHEIREYPHIKPVNVVAFKLLTEVRSVIESRLDRLKDKMIEDEKKEKAFVLIALTTNKPSIIRCYGYKTGLTKKMLDSINIEDNNYLTTMLQELASFMYKTLPIELLN